jgi:hypothetical protein
MERQFGLVTRRRWRQNRPANGQTTHVYRRLQPFAATLCGDVVEPGSRGWDDPGPPLTDLDLHAVNCGRCRAYLVRQQLVTLDNAS